MKRFVVFSILLLGFSAVAVAQDTPAAEVFGGYSYLRCDTGSDDISCNLNGWNGSAAFNVNQTFGVVADFGGYYGTVEDVVKMKLHSFMFGPKFAFRSNEKVTPFVQALFGGIRSKFEIEGEGSFSETDLAMAFGGGLDINVSDRIAIRPVQFEYVPVRVSDEVSSDWSHNLRYSAGIVFKLGKR